MSLRFDGFYRVGTSRRAALWLVAGILTLLLLSLEFPAIGSAYEGVYCYEVQLGSLQGCEGSKVSDIRRAIGKAPGGLTGVEIETTTEIAYNKCGTAGCEADTGYLGKDGTGEGWIYNEGSGTHTYKGYLYP
jgi:hypothetical protein